MFILDSSVIIDVMKGHNVSMLEKLSDEETLATTVFSVHEVLVGLTDSERHIGNDFFGNIGILDFSKDAALKSIEIEKNLTKKGRKINKVDVFIASICIENNCTLITSDKRFRDISGLKTILV